jgi:hypothetical protein
MPRFPAATTIAVMTASLCWAILPPQRSRNTNRLGDLHIGGVFGFEPNVGQAGRGVAFVARGRDYALTLSSSELVLTYLEGFGDVDRWFHEEVVRLKLEQAQSSVETAGLDPLPGKSVFRLRADIPNYARVLFEDVYPGIDLLCFGSQKRLELQFVIRAGARPESIRLAWDGARRAHVNPGWNTSHAHAPR